MQKAIAVYKTYLHFILFIIGCCEKRIRPYRQCCQTIRAGCGSAATAVAEADCKGYVKSMFTVDAIKRKLPILKWLPKYGLKELQGDAIAGTTVALTVIPQGLALAQLAELPPQYGLYSAFMGCIIYCVFGTAKDITLGPTAIMSLMTAEFGVFHNEALYGDVTLAVILTLFTGIIQLIMGVLYVGPASVFGAESGLDSTKLWVRLGSGE
ncbi:hypothetical protein NP493_4427g00002, partial [Ridgeia piscesae]